MSDLFAGIFEEVFQFVGEAVFSQGSSGVSEWARWLSLGSLGGGVFSFVRGAGVWGWGLLGAAVVLLVARVVIEVRAGRMKREVGG